MAGRARARRKQQSTKSRHRKMRRPKGACAGVVVVKAANPHGVFEITYRIGRAHRLPGSGARR
jgi:hypothetical protein